MQGGGGSADADGAAAALSFLLSLYALRTRSSEPAF